MKNKILIFTIVISATITNCFAQLCGINSNNPNNLPLFDWTQDNTVNWYFDINKSPQAIHLPYFCNGNNNQNIDDGCSNENLSYYGQIRNNSGSLDIFPADGWELLSYNFGNATTANQQPYFILYNKYTAKVKLFVLAVAPPGGQPQTRASVNITWAPGSNTFNRLLTHQGPIIFPIKGGNLGTSINALNDIAALDGVSATNLVPQYQWLGAEWIAGYDPCTCNLSTPLQISFSIQYFNPTDFDATISGEGENSSPPTTNFYSSTALNTNINNDGSFVIGGAENSTFLPIDDYNSFSYWETYPIGIFVPNSSFLKSHRDFSSYANKITDNLTDISAQGSGATSSLNTGNDFVNGVVSSINTANNISTSSSQSTINSSVLSALNSNGAQTIANALGANDAITGTAGNIDANPYIANTAGLVDFFVAQDGDNSTNPSPPIASTVHDKINFTISNPPSGSKNFTFYNNIPVGTPLNGTNVLPLPGSSQSYSGTDNVPIYNNVLGVFDLFSIPDFDVYKLNVTNEGIDPAQLNTGGDRCNLNPPGDYQFFDYKLLGPINYVLNPASGLTVESIDAAFVFEFNAQTMTNKNSNFTNKYYNPIFITPKAQTDGNTQQQVLYFPGMDANYYNAPTNTASFNDRFTGDGTSNVMPMSQVLASMKTVGLELEYQSPGYKSVDPVANDENSVIRFRTKYVPLQCLENVDFILCGAPGISPYSYIKLYCKFKRPDGKLITAIYTYDVTKKLNSASNQTNFNPKTGGGGSYYFYSADPSTGSIANGFCASWLRHITFSGLYLYGAYGSPNYGDQPGANYTPLTSGLISTGSVDVPYQAYVLNGSPYAASLTNNNYTGIKSMQDINIADQVQFNVTYSRLNPTLSGPQYPDALTYAMANNNINCGYNLVINSPTNFYAGNKITFADNTYIYGFLVNHASWLDGYNIGATNIFAHNDIAVSSNTIISGEVTLGINGGMSISSIMHGCDPNTEPISNYDATNSIDNAACQAMGERLMALTNNKPTTQPKKTDINVTKLGTNIKLGIFPNPTRGIIYLDLSAQNAGSLLVNISDLNGNQVMHNSFNANEGANSFKVDLSSVNQGVYFINITDENGVPIKNDKVVLLPQ